MTGSPQEPQIVAGEERHVVATVRDYRMDTRGEIPAQWQAFFEVGYRIANARDGAMFGVSFMADGKGAFRYGVGVEVDPVPDTVPDGTCVITLSAGDYAVLRRFGPVSELPGELDWLFSHAISGLGRRPREGAVFERYPDDPRNGPEGMAYELWAPVGPAAGG